MNNSLHLLRNFVVSLILLFSVGDCVVITFGLLSGSRWLIFGVEAAGTYTVYDGEWTVRNVPDKFLRGCR